MAIEIGRRQFVADLGGTAVFGPLSARAQQPAMPAVGFLHAGSPQPIAHLVGAFRKGLSETGYVKGQNVAIEFRWAEGQYDRLPELAADLIRRRVAVIAVPDCIPAVLAAKAVISTIPIVFATGTWSVASLSRPGGNVTGYSLLNTELAAKRLGFLHEWVPAAAHFVELVNPNSDLTKPTIKDIQAGAATIGPRIEFGI